MRSAVAVLIQQHAVTAAADYDSVHREGSEKGFDLPYADEMGPVIEDLAGIRNPDAAKLLFSTTEKTLMGMIRQKLGVTGARADYYELLIRAHCKNVLIDRMRSLKNEIQSIKKVLK